MDGHLPRMHGYYSKSRSSAYGKLLYKDVKIKVSRSINSIRKGFKYVNLLSRGHLRSQGQGSGRYSVQQ